MLSRRQAHYVFVAIVAFLMSGVLSLAMLLVNRGIPAGFLGLWMRSWGVAFLVAFPTALVIVPVVRRGVDRMVGR